VTRSRKERKLATLSSMSMEFVQDRPDVGRRTNSA